MRNLTILFLIITIVTSCSSLRDDNCSDVGNIDENVFYYYQQGLKMSETNKSFTRAAEQKNKYSAYAPYAEKFENVLRLSSSELQKIVADTTYTEMISLFEESFDNNPKSIFDYIDPKEYIQCVDILSEYIEVGGHNVDRLQAMSEGVLNNNMLLILGQSAALLDNYADQLTLEELSRQIVSDNKKKACKDILNQKLAILSIEVTWSYVTSLLLPGALVGVGITSFYAMSTTVLYIVQYQDCVKRSK